MYSIAYEKLHFISLIDQDNVFSCKEALRLHYKFENWIIKFYYEIR